MSSKRLPSDGAWRAVLIVSWFCLAVSLRGDEPKVTKNPDGSTTTSERVSFGKDGINSGPFVGTGEKRTIRDKDGNPTKFEWVLYGKRKEKPAMEVFVQANPNTNRTTVTTYRYLKDGKTLESKTDQVFSTKDGTMLYDRSQTYDSTGKNPATGITHAFEGWEDGKTDTWKTQQWNPKTGEWEKIDDSGVNQSSYPKLGTFLDDLQKRWGSAGLVLERSPSPTPSPSPGKAPDKTLSSLIGQKSVAWELAGTGETIGHIADCKIQNLTSQPISFVIPALVLESSSGKNQHYACPEKQTIALGPKQSKTVPMDGVCLDRSKPPVGKGVTGDLVINEASPGATQMAGSHLPTRDANKMLRLASAKYDAAEKLQKEGELKELPYRDKQKQKDIVIQWSVWSDPRICDVTGAPPATKKDLQNVVYKQVEEKGPMKPETKKKVDQGIDTIFEKVELTTTRAKDLEEPEDEGFAAGTTTNISNDTPTPGSQTQEKPKKDKKKKENKKWPKPIQDWVDAKKRALSAEGTRRYFQGKYEDARQRYFEKNEHWRELNEKAEEAARKALRDETKENAANANNARKELKDLEKQLEQDFNKTDGGKFRMDNVRDAEKELEKADAAEKEAGKNVDSATKAVVEAQETWPDPAVPGVW